MSAADAGRVHDGKVAIVKGLCPASVESSHPCHPERFFAAPAGRDETGMLVASDAIAVCSLARPARPRVVAADRRAWVLDAADPARDQRRIQRGTVRPAPD